MIARLVPVAGQRAVVYPSLECRGIDQRRRGREGGGRWGCRRRGTASPAPGQREKDRTQKEQKRGEYIFFPHCKSPFKSAYAD